MNLLTLLILVAVIGVVGSLGMGVVSMARHGEAAHHSSEHWMTARVLFQGLALLLLLVAMSVA